MYKYKKFGILVLIISILATSVLTYTPVKAKTLGDLKRELQESKEKYAKTKE